MSKRLIAAICAALLSLGAVACDMEGADDGPGDPGTADDNGNGVSY